MKASTIVAAAVALTGSMVSAQLGNIPPCALTCAVNSLGSSGCQATDIKCVCSASAFLTALTPCVQAACSASDYQAALQAAVGLCKSVGVNLSIPGGGASTSAPATSSAMMSSAPASSAAATTSTAVVVSTSSAVVTMTTTTSSMVMSSNATMTHSISVVPTNATMTMMSPSTSTALPTASPSGNAAGRNTVALGGLGFLAFAAALL